MHLGWSGNGSLSTAKLSARMHPNSRMWEGNDSNPKGLGLPGSTVRQKKAQKTERVLRLGFHKISLDIRWLSSSVPVDTFLLLIWKEVTDDSEIIMLPWWLLQYSKRWQFTVIVSWKQRCLGYVLESDHLQIQPVSWVFVSEDASFNATAEVKINVVSTPWCWHSSTLVTKEGNCSKLSSTTLCSQARKRTCSQPEMAASFAYGKTAFRTSLHLFAQLLSGQPPSTLHISKRKVSFYMWIKEGPSLH